MTESEQTKIFANNLKHYVNLSNKQQKEISKELNIPYQTFNGWCKGVSFPSMDKIQILADYFHIGKSDLIDLQKGNHKIYLTDEEEKIIIAYRKLPDSNKDMLCLSLGITREKTKHETA